MQRTIHNKGRARHIADILQNGEEEKQQQYLRQKGKHRTQASDDAVTDKARGPIRSANSGEQAAHCLRQCSINQIADEIAQPRAERQR